MRKLSKLKLNDFQEMTEMEMKNVVGGSGVVTGTCAVILDDGFVYRHKSKEAVLDIMERGWGTNWCCDNCDKASWY